MRYPRIILGNRELGVVSVGACYNRRMKFQDRTDAGRQLAEQLQDYCRQHDITPDDIIIYSLPRGGTVLGAEIAKQFGVTHDVVITRKVGHPNNPEYAICALGEQTEPICNEQEIAQVSEDWLQDAVDQERAEAKRRSVTYRQENGIQDARGKVAVIVDDGIATGLTVQAAVREIKRLQPRQVLVAIPIAPQDSVRALGQLTDGVITVDIPAMYLGSVGAYYQHFPQTTDAEVIDLLQAGRQ